MMAKAAATATTTAKKKKSRPSWGGLPSPRPPSGTGRRSLRPRRGRSVVAGLEDSWSSEEERGKRKLKLVLKLPNVKIQRDERVTGSPEASSSGSPGFANEEDEVESEEEAMKPLKKRRIDGCHGRALDSHGSVRREEKRRNGVWRATTKSVSGSSPGSRIGMALPDRKRLEAILDKLQKKDTYRAFAEPVDPEELPDYHDVIEHPMDFGTIRKRLARSAYRCFEQFEDDVFLVCSNAMQYNAPDTVYFRQAHAIQEMARRKFQSLQADSTCAEAVQADSKHFEAVQAERKFVQIVRVDSKCVDAIRDDKKHLDADGSDSECAEDFRSNRKCVQTARADSKGVQTVQADNKGAQTVRPDKKCVQNVQADSKCVQTVRANNKSVRADSKSVQADSKCVRAFRADSKSVRADSKCVQAFRADSNSVRADSKCIQAVRADSKCVEVVRADSKCVEAVRAGSKCVEAVRADSQCTQTERKHEEKMKFLSMAKNQVKKSFYSAAQEPVGSEISSGAILASLVDTYTELKPAQASECEKPVNVNGFADDGASLCDTKPDKEDDLSAQCSPSPRCSPSKLGLKPVVIDENRRETYNISNQDPVAESDLLFVPFESEPKQLISVGLEAEYSYARSLARFAGALGPIAWRIASEKIEKALPHGMKFGPGWVGEYEPLPTSTLSFENHSHQEAVYSTELKCRGQPNKKGAEDRSKATQNGESKGMRKGHDMRTAIGKADRSSITVKQGPSPVGATEKKVPFGIAAQANPALVNTMLQKHKDQSPSELSWARTSVLEHLPACNSSSPASFSDEKANHRPDYSSPVAVPRFRGMLSRNGSYVLPENLRHPVTPQCEKMSLTMGCKEAEKSSSNRQTTMINFISDHQSGVAAYSHTSGDEHQVVDDPCRLMGFSGKVSYHSNGSNTGITTPKQAMSALLQPKTEHSSAAAAAAQVWMSIGASAEHKSIPTKQVESASFDNPAWNMPTSAPRVQEYSLARPATQVFPQPFQVATEESMVQRRGLVFFPQLVGNDSPRFRTQSPWQGLSPNSQNKQRKDTLRPDLNIGYQPPGSPVRQTAGILVDSPQPDLALQL